MSLSQILRLAAENDASDIHLVAGHPPLMRVHTVVMPMEMSIFSLDLEVWWERTELTLIICF